MSQKVNKNEFLQMISNKTNMRLSDVETVYEAIVSEIQALTLQGKDVSLTGFGTFSLKPHKGHPVQVTFKKGHSEARVPSIPCYMVFKFAASSALTARLRKAYAQMHQDADQLEQVG